MEKNLNHFVVYLKLIQYYKATILNKQKEKHLRLFQMPSENASPFP